MSLLEQASLVMIPSGYKEDVVYCPKPTDGSGDLTFTRASDGTRVNSSGYVENVPWNFVAQSESIGTSPWLTNGATLTSGQTDPNGGTTAIKVELASGGNNYVYQGIPLTNPVNIVSAYLRADSATTIGFSMGGSTPNAVNLTTSWQLFTFSSTDTSGGIIFDNYFGPSPTQQAKTFYIWHPQLNQGSTAKPYFPTTDRLNVPRLTYEGGCPSLLLEPQRTNLATYSEDFSNVAYAKLNATITTNQTTSPDGTTNADKLTDDSSNDYHIVYPNTLSITASRITASVYLKNNDIQFGAVQLATSIGSAFNTRFTIVVDLINGTITDTEQTGTPNATYSIQSVGNGWYRLIVSVDHSSGDVSCVVAGSNSGTPSSFTAALPAYSGTGKSLFLWGMQIEAGSYPTSYIPTTSAAVTRLADAAYKTGISSLIGQTEGTIFVDINRTQKSENYQVPFFIGSNPNIVQLYFTSTNACVGQVYTSAGQQVAIISSALANGRYKIALAYASNDFAMYINGTQIGTDSSGTVPTCSQVIIGNDDSGASNFNDSINQAILFKTRLTNDELAALTTL